MDIFLLFLLFLIVIAVGYILSKPFMQQDAVSSGFSQTPDYDFQYRQLLLEIKNLERECDTEVLSDDICDQIDLLKKQAVELLKQIHTGPEEHTPPQDTSVYTSNDSTDNLHEQEQFCPKCGSLVIPSDKFCTRCGQSLKL